MAPLHIPVLSKNPQRQIQLRVVPALFIAGKSYRVVSSLLLLVTHSASRSFCFTVLESVVLGRTLCWTRCFDKSKSAEIWTFLRIPSYSSSEKLPHPDRRVVRIYSWRSSRSDSKVSSGTPGHVFGFIQNFATSPNWDFLFHSFSCYADEKCEFPSLLEYQYTVRIGDL